MKIVIVGGGTAGWISALYSKKMYPEYEIFLIENEKIGILGAGEGSVPPIVEMLDFLEIPTFEIIKNCNATIKNGIKFTNWSNHGDSFYHPFLSLCPASNDYNFSINHQFEIDTSFSHFLAAKNNHEFKDYVLYEKMSELNKIPFIKNKENRTNQSAISNFNQIGSWSIHFDANLLAAYLKKIGTNRNIKIIEGFVENVCLDENGYINKIILKNNIIDNVSFVFDCTGFKREIIGKVFNSKWKSHSKSLPCDTAIPFFLPMDEKIPPFTESIALKYGWMWKIPVQGRYGCGYVFDSNFISSDNALKEVNDFLGFEINSPKEFKFDAGVYEKVWIKNCLAVGLSSGFIEPLEATSIFQSYSLIKDFFSLSENINCGDEQTKNMLNKKYLKITEEIVEFIYLHYLTDKKNTEFWKSFKENNTTPEFIDYILDVCKIRPISENLDFFEKTKFFNFYNYYYILIGNNIIDKKILIQQSKFFKDKNNDYLNILNNQNKFIELLKDHNEFIKGIKI